MALPRDISPVLDRTPPQNVELEMCVLGAVMLEPREAYQVVADYLSAESFYLDGHALIFQLMGELMARGIPPDATSVIDELRSRSLLENVGGSGVVLGMLNSVPTAANVEYHAKKVAEKAHLRSLIHTCSRIVEECFAQEAPVEDILDRAEQGILKLSTRSVEAEFHVLAEVLRRYWEKLSDRSERLEKMREDGIENPRLPAGLPTGFVDLDIKTGGLRESELTIIAARPSVGKTALALNIAHFLAVKQSVPVAIFSLEMGAEQLAERLLSMGTLHTDPRSMVVGGISTTEFQNPEFSPADWKLLTESYSRLSQAPIYLDESSYLTVRMLKSKVRRLHSRHPLGLVLVDYLQLMSGTSTHDGRVQEVSEISRGLKQLSRELRIPVIALSQLSRQVESRQTKRPQLSDLRESGSIEQDADVVMFIHRPDDYDDKKQKLDLKSNVQDKLPDMELIIAKNRNGPTGPVPLRFLPQLTRFLSSDRKL